MILVINFKTYAEAAGDNAAALAQEIEAVLPENEKAIICVQACDIRYVKTTCGCPIFAQHIDAFPPGKHTGFQSAEALMQAGASGCLINHSEHELSLADIKTTIAYARQLQLTTIVCAKDAETAGKIAAFKPDYVAVEPPALIGGDISVSTSDPDLIRQSYIAVSAHQVPLLVGAGIKSGQDVAIAQELGAVGVLVSSAVIKASDVAAAVRELSHR